MSRGVTEHLFTTPGSHLAECVGPDEVHEGLLVVPLADDRVGEWVIHALVEKALRVPRHVCEVGDDLLKLGGEQRCLLGDHVVVHAHGYHGSSSSQELSQSPHYSARTTVSQCTSASPVSRLR